LFKPALDLLEDRLVLAVSLQLHVPPSSSYGVNNSLVVEYSNTGSTAVPAPVVLLSADNANLWLPSDPAVSDSTLQLLATGPTGSAGTLAPGASGTIVVDYTATSSTASAVNFSVGQLATGQTINWASLEAGMEPVTIPANAWNAVFANFTTNVGSTTDSYQAALDADATYLAQLGEPTNDVAQLVAYEINKAADSFSTPTLGDNIDASLPTPGSLSLTFDRWFQPGIAGRYQMGTLGLGWTDNWAITASTDSSGNVTINESGTLRYFAMQSDGAYVANLGDHGVLTALSGGGYQLTETDGSSTVFNTDGTLDYVQDSNGNRITATYTSGLLTRLTASNGEYLALTYTSGLLTKVTDSTGEVSTYAYDSTGQYLLSYTDEFGTTSYSYVTGQGAASQNALASITYAENSHDYFSYDAEGRLIDEHQDNDQQDVTISYGAAGGYTTDADGDKITVLTDDNGQVRETIDPLGNVTHYTYDVSGNLTAVDGPQGSDYVYTYDANGNLFSATDPLGLTTQFTYNANNDLTSYTDPNGNTTSYAYDSSNDLLSITYADGTKEQFNNYNPLGEAAQYVNANGQAIGFAYNSQRLVTTENFAGGSSYSYTYDVHGNMLTATSSSGTIQFQYQDSANPDLLTEVDYPNGQYVKFTYNAIGQRTQSVDQTGFTVNYTYDALGRLQELTDGNGKLIVQYTYGAAGNLIQEDMGNGTRTVYTYDGDGDVLSITNYAPNHATVNSFDRYTYDALGNVLTDTNQDGEWAYTYDADSQLIDAVFTPNSSDPDGLISQNLQYVYDAAGNRVSQTVNGVTTTYAVNNVNEYTSSTTNGVTTTYQYDNDGNLISQTTAGSATTYSYDELDELTGVNGPGQTDSYTYDALGNRTSQTINGTTTQFLSDPTGFDNVVSSYTGVGSLIAHYTYGSGLVSQVSSTGTAGYYDFDLTGSTVGITDTAGNYVNKYCYLPFGQTTTIASALSNPFTFDGQWSVMNEGGGLLLMGMRSYDPVIGQFTSNDPLGIDGADANVRRYVMNSPTNSVDATGLGSLPAKDAKGVYNVPSAFWTAVKLSMMSQLQTHLSTTTLWNSWNDKYYLYPGYSMAAVWDNDYFHNKHNQDKFRFQDGSFGNNVVTGHDVNYYFQGWIANAYGYKDVKTIITNYSKKFKNKKPTDAEVEAATEGYKNFEADKQLWVQYQQGTTDNTQPQTSGGGPFEGSPATLEVGEWYGPGTPTATTVFNELGGEDYVLTTTDTFDEQSPENYIINATVTFPEAQEYGVTTTVNGDDVVEDPEHEAIIVYDAPMIVNSVNITVAAGGTYDGPVATFTDLNPYGNLSQYEAWTEMQGSGTEVPATIEAGPGNNYTVMANLDYTYDNPGSTDVLVGVWDVDTPWNPEGGGVISDNVTVTDSGLAQYSTTVLAQVIQANGSQPYDPPLAIVTTTDPNITSASQVSVTTGTPPSANSPYPLVTGTTLTLLPNGVKQIVVDGVVSAVQPGAGPVAAAPLNITLAGEAPLSAQLEVDETSSEYVVNPVVVNATADQPVRNIQVATLAGPLNGAYSATIDWGGGDTSTGQVTPLGGDLFTVTGSKPHVYTAAGSDTITVTVSGPGETNGAGSSVTDTALVAPPPGVLSNVSGTGTYAGTGTLSATLTAGGTALAGKTVSFTLTVGKSIENVGSATTNSSGVATLTGVNLAGYSTGTYSGVVTASFAGDTNDSSGSASGGLQVNVASAQLHLSNLTLSYDGGAQFATLSTSPAGIGGVTVNYTQNKAVVAAPTKPGSYQVTVSLNNANYTAQTITGTLVINPATPVIQWAAPAAIAPGTALGSAQLDATATFNGSPLAGLFVYLPAAGTVLNTGPNQTLTVQFTPTDTVDFTAASASVSIHVLPPPVTVTSMGLTTVKVGSGRKAKKETVLQIQFSGALNSNDADNRAAYQLFSGSTKKSHTVFNNRLKVVSAVYNPQALTVRLFAAQKLTLAHPLELEITAALIPDIYGRALDGNDDGQPGANFTGTLSKNGVTLARVMAANVGRPLQPGSSHKLPLLPLRRGNGPETPALMPSPCTNQRLG